MIKKIDKGLLLALIFLVGLGLVQVYSSSFIFAEEKYSNGLFFFFKQLKFSFLGLFLTLIVANTPWKYIEKWGFIIGVLAIIGIICTFIPGLGIKAGGATRWLSLPMGQRIEPSEVFKVFWPILIASIFFSKNKWIKKQDWKILLGISLVVFALLLRQPDFGTVGICTLTLAVILFCFGLKWRYIFFGTLTVVPLLSLLIYLEPYRYKRFVSFLDPWSDPSQNGFQVIQSLLGYYSGGLFGQGLGQGQAKLFFLPEAHTDFTLAVLGEEMGYFGFVIVLLLFGYIIFRGLQVSTRAKSPFAQMVAIGLTTNFALSVIINVGVTLGMLPTKGLALPFLSYGGSSLVSSCLLIGLLLSIDRESGGVRKSPRRKRKAT